VHVVFHLENLVDASDLQLNIVDAFDKIWLLVLDVVAHHL
jgi:hypothetical protein